MVLYLVLGMKRDFSGLTGVLMLFSHSSLDVLHEPSYLKKLKRKAKRKMISSSCSAAILLF